MSLSKNVSEKKNVHHEAAATRPVSHDPIRPDNAAAAMKYRVRTKGAKKGVRWGRGQSSSSNPEKTRHRDAARTRAALMGTSGPAAAGQPFATLEALPSKLTAESLLKHDALLAKGPGAAGGAESDAVSLGQTHKTFETFASDWTNCENASFDRLIKYVSNKWKCSLDCF